ncbi:MAG: ABC transporter permease [Thermogemmatispora sp.]|uniref:ABC transporter permease n=1 Tax=Thermogemmatispora sp. TaxID=1968838 RepID=UPI002624853E|nr:ABC transporter permease [Thermogemmatispora sp.]MBX5457169.1 ABC transporter permease [Thermogemmatispora sp.]
MQATNLGEPSVDTAALIEQADQRHHGPFLNALRLLYRNPKIAVGLGILLLFVLMALAAPLLTPYPPDGPQSQVAHGAQPPSREHILGTTSLGQDMFSQIAYGARVSLLIGFVAATGSTLLQVIFGLSSAYFGSLIDEVLSLLINVFLVLPGLPLAIVLASLANASGVGKNEFVIAMVLLFTSWAYGARVLRSQTLSLKEREFVTAARSMGEVTWRTIFLEILPNEIALVASTYVGTFVYALGAEVALEFLGLGDVSHASWGSILFWAQLNGALITGQWWLFVPAGVCVALVCGALTLVNFGIDELANPSLRQAMPRKLRKLLKARAVVA